MTMFMKGRRSLRLLLCASLSILKVYSWLSVAMQSISQFESLVLVPLSNVISTVSDLSKYQQGNAVPLITTDHNQSEPQLFRMLFLQEITCISIYLTHQI